MGKDVDFRLNPAGVRQLLQSAEMMNAVTSLANKARSRLGSGYEVSTMTGRNRVNAEIRTATAEAAKENSKSNTLLKALGGAKA